MCHMPYATGGGWTLVVGINGLTQQHLESGSVGTRCRGGDVCIIHRTSGIIPVRKLDDRIIRVLADDEGLFVSSLAHCDMLGGLGAS